MSCSKSFNLASAINTASIKRLESVRVINTKLVRSILKILYDLGCIRGFCCVDSSYIAVYLKYIHNRVSFSKIRMYNKKIYIKNKNILKFIPVWDGTFVLSTSWGLLTDIECVLGNRGGELMLYYK